MASHYITVAAQYLKFQRIHCGKQNLRLAAQRRRYPHYCAGTAAASARIAMRSIDIVRMSFLCRSATAIRCVRVHRWAVANNPPLPAGMHPPDLSMARWVQALYRFVIMIRNAVDAAVNAAKTPRCKGACSMAMATASARTMMYRPMLELSGPRMSLSPCRDYEVQIEFIPREAQSRLKLRKSLCVPEGDSNRRRSLFQSRSLAALNVEISARSILFQRRCYKSPHLAHYRAAA